jgi:IS5 family transposase
MDCLILSWNVKYQNVFHIMNFLGFPETIPDYSTVWHFRERLSQTGKDQEIWDEVQRQLNNKGLKVKTGVVQDTSFITADPGHARADKPRGPEVKTRRNKDGKWTKKGGKSYYRYKIHTKTDINYSLIRKVENTPANVHDSRIDLINPEDVVYRDRGYFGVPYNGYNATMDRNVRRHKITIRQKRRNERITRKRAPWERLYAVIKNYSVQATN